MGLMDLYAGNIEKAAQARATGRLNAEAAQRAAGADAAQGLMGYNIMQTGADGLTTGMSGGLMANPNDPMSHISAGMGLMQIPGYEAAAQQFLSQGIGSQLGQQHKLAQFEQQERYNQQMLEMQRIKTQAGLNKDYQTMANTLRDDAVSAVAPYRAAIEQYNDVNNLIADAGGFAGMNHATDIALMKGYAKIMLPGEAVMTDDMAMIAQSDKFSSVIRGLANKINYGQPLDETERKQLHDAMNSLMTGKLEQYGQAREDFTSRALRAMINPADVMRTKIDADLRSFELVPSAPGEVTDQQLQKDLNAQVEAEEKANQGRLGNAWDALWGN
ncbi:MAG: hypothetical protein ACR2P6_07575 [Gammaproteobacteria bacterium]